MTTKWPWKNPSSWKEVTLIFVLSRLTILLVAVVSIALFSPNSQVYFVPDVVNVHYQPYDIWSYLFAWWRWDAVHLTKIAAYGYQNDLGYRAFLPLYPLLQRGIGNLLQAILQPGSPSGREAVNYFAGVILANICCYGGMLLCYALVKKEIGARVTRLMLLLLALYPYSIFLFAGYTEPLFFLLTVAVFFFLQHERWWLASICAALLLVTRVAGALIVIPFLILYVQRFWPEWRKSVLPWRKMLITALPIAIIPLGLGIYMAYLYLICNDPFVFRTAEESWNRHISTLGYGLYLNLKVLTTAHLRIDQIYSNVADIVFSIGPLIALLLGWKRLPLHYRLFSLAIVLFSMSTYAVSVNPARCYPRFVVAAFPLFMLYAQWGKRQPIIFILLAVCFLILQIIDVALFVTGYWVA